MQAALLLGQDALSMMSLRAFLPPQSRQLEGSFMQLAFPLPSGVWQNGCCLCGFGFLESKMGWYHYGLVSVCIHEREG